MKKEIERFSAASRDGTYITTIILFQESLTVGSPEDPIAVRPTLKLARTIEGFSCDIYGDDILVLNDPRYPAGIAVKRSV